ncbi:DUF429 domain-containing protein [Microcella humidisoli]|uniref:DUF429 domain-containing protein n=1 Tax=Microcella humidisoli TaxID=2963406 RepID=A0ABY5FWA9_9MICO|nr:DUF429 domain-containing protein [Microcella humidisoli]UTT62595.1 DUF429 domain-containing protein [Microcella humidisoli]
MSARVAGVDLAAEAAGTAVAVLRIDRGALDPGAGGGSGGATVVLESLRLGVDDAALLAATRDARLIGIDCALGWPVDFVDFVGRQASGERLADSDTGDLAWRRRLAFRETDRVVTERTGARPLSVATDRLGMTALRCAVLLDRLAGDGRVVDRSGEHPSVVVEVYPAMALRVWGLAARGYKAAGGAAASAAMDARTALIDDVSRAAPWLQLGEHRRTLMRESADALDAVLAALVALAHGAGASIPPEPQQRKRARVEGWIAIPTVGLAQLGAIL